MSILIKSPPTGNWVSVDRTAAKDPRITLQAKGLHSYISTCPPNWAIHEKDIINRCLNGRDAVRNAMKELITFGYLIKTKTRKAGKFDSTTYECKWEPTVAWKTGDGKTGAGKPTPLVTTMNDREQQVRVDGTPYHNGFAAEPPSRPEHLDDSPGEEPSPGPKQLTKIIPLREQLKQARPPTLPRKPVPPITVPKVLRPLVDYWGEHCIRHREGTKVYRNGVKALKEVVAGTYFHDKPHYQDKSRPYTVAEVREAMERFEACRNNPLYIPSDKSFHRGITLPDFFYSPLMHNGHAGLGGSMFLQMLEKTPVLAGDRDPDLTNHVRNRLFEILGARVTYQEAARAANKITRYWSENEERLKRYNVRGDKNLATLWMTMCEEWKPGQWHLGHLTGSSLNDMFTNWLKENS